MKNRVIFVFLAGLFCAPLFAATRGGAKPAVVAESSSNTEAKLSPAGAARAPAVAAPVAARAAARGGVIKMPPAKNQPKNQEQPKVSEPAQQPEQGATPLAGSSNNAGAEISARPPAAPASPTPKVSAARAASKTKVMGTGDAKIAASKADNGVAGNPCKEEYWGCMDMFCMSSNESGGRCACSNDTIKFDREYKAAVAAVEAEMDKKAAIETQLEYGDNSGTRAGAAGMEISAECDDDDDMACKIGAAKYNAAAKLCEEQVSAECKSNYAFTKLQYSQNIRNDCNAYGAAIKDIKEKGMVALAAARKETRDMAAEKFEAANKYNEGQCIIALKTCMNGKDACGENWTRCTEDNIADKRIICEKVLNECANARESAWEGFVAEIRPTLKNAALTAENASRQDCLGNMSDCLVKACADNIDGMGETMDGCLARPEMVQSFCKVELDRCDPNGRMWNFVKQKLAAMRVDRCVDEVRQCFTSEERCGKDFGKCLGLDIYALTDMCPVDKLVVCKQDKADFQLADVGNMVMGMFLQIDDKQFEDCQNLIFEKMEEVCGSGVNCNQFANPEMGTNSLRYMNTGGVHVITGWINWDGVGVSSGTEWGGCMSNGGKDCDKFSRPGDILVGDYIADMKRATAAVPAEAAALAKGVEETIEMELKSVAGEINRIVALLEQDQKIGWCVNGRDLSQITGNKGEKTTARFPLLSQMQRRIIAEAALAKAVENYNRRAQKLMDEAEAKMDEQAAEYACYARPKIIGGRAVQDPGNAKKAEPPIGAFSPVKIIGKSASPSEIAALAGKHSVAIDSVLTKEVSATYAPATKNCHICVNDRFSGKRGVVDLYVGDAEQLKKDIDKAKKQKNALAVGVAVGAMAAIPVAGWVGAGMLAAGGAAAFRMAGMMGDPREEVITKNVDYCYDEVMGSAAQ